jgi:hypothetical protein
MVEVVGFESSGAKLLGFDSLAVGFESLVEY